MNRSTLPSIAASISIDLCIQIKHIRQLFIEHLVQSTSGSIQPFAVFTAHLAQVVASLFRSDFVLWLLIIAGLALDIQSTTGIGNHLVICTKQPASLFVRYKHTTTATLCKIFRIALGRKIEKSVPENLISGTLSLLDEFDYVTHKRIYIRSLPATGLWVCVWIEAINTGDMKLRYRYRIYPTPTQAQQMTSVGGATRFLYNHFLRVNIDEYQQTKKFVWQFDMCKQLTQLKQQHLWLSEIYSQVLQQSLKDLDSALKNMKKTGAGFPQFKSKYTTPVSFRYQQHTSLIKNNRYLRLPKIGDVRIKLHRSLPSNYTGCTIIQTPLGWYVSFVVEQGERPLVDKITNPVGVDVNSDFTALSTGELINNPKPMKKKNNRIKLLQRKLSRKQKSSRNRIKAKQKLARLHTQIRCQRSNHTHQTSARIAKAHDLVSVETLKIEEMRRKSRAAAKTIADAGWAMMLSDIAYKCQLLGHHFIKINQWLPSSKTCSSCGHKKPSIPLSQREYHCEMCGYTDHRDINAAINICNYGHQQWNNEYARQELPQAPVDLVMDVLANWGQISSSDMKQEALSL